MNGRVRDGVLVDHGGAGVGPVKGAAIRYRVMAYIVGVLLIVLVVIGVPLKYLGGDDAIVSTVGPVHGVLYMVYLLATLDLARRVRWSLGYVVLVALAGTIPFLTFVAERRVAHRLTETSGTASRA